MRSRRGLILAEPAGIQPQPPGKAAQMAERGSFTLRQAKKQLAGGGVRISSGEVGEAAPVAGDDPMLLTGAPRQRFSGNLASGERTDERMACQLPVDRCQLGPNLVNEG